MNSHLFLCITCIFNMKSVKFSFFIHKISKVYNKSFFLHAIYKIGSTFGITNGRRLYKKRLTFSDQINSISIVFFDSLRSFVNYPQKIEKTHLHFCCASLVFLAC